mmetsp:Transcript_93597/g.222515  ORF Transcript_93597/g.222515 Transcript_93597/m.222515 type:complete len:216 (-) Transcript_93597:142-789(-)|eukprot:CAMPEP_0181407550 /NCGR_PEP_ID=MMETSP1110-20121109/5838_1 /TAXON_ID=174948 /ORGANISM="Symbiodinium sp., Strain CCMP421" /LENGTH=215 /DNA_ID=CAMNT_0023529983 /DNA_START=35 /DNA_END=682 /DNA_ORIENTATION=-
MAWLGFSCWHNAGLEDELVLNHESEESNLELVYQGVEDVEPEVLPHDVGENANQKRVHFDQEISDSISTRASVYSESDVSRQQSPVPQGRTHTPCSDPSARHLRKVNQFLRKNGFTDVNCKRRELAGLSCTYPLHVAAEQNDVKLVSLLIHFGASVTQKDGRGRTAYDCVCQKPTHSQVCMLLQRRSDCPLQRNRGSHWDAFFSQLERHPMAHRR